MKKYLSCLGASLVAIAALSSCNKELTDPNEGIKGGIPFEITAASVDTRTSIDGVTTSWVAGDAINLFHAVAKSTIYTSDGEFTIAAEDLEAKKFKGTLAAALEAGSYDWYAFYPYNSYNKTPAGSSKDDFGYTTIGGTSQTQTGNSSTAHLCGKPCPLYGIATGVASNDAPSIKMNHLASIIEVNVTNNSGEELTVTSVSFTGTEDIVGTYYIDFTKTPIVYTPSGDKYVSSTASLSVSDGEAIVAGSSATFYIAIKPFTVSSGVLKVAVNGYEKEIEISNKTVFAAGNIKKINFNYNKTPEVFSLVKTDNAFEDGGKYVLAFKNGTDDTYYFISNAGSSNNLSKRALTVTDGDIKNPDAAYVFTATADGSGFKLANSVSKYIYNSGSNTTLNTNNNTASTWYPSFISASKTYKLSQGSTTGRYISYGTSETDVKGYTNSNFKDQIANKSALAQYSGAISVFKLGYSVSHDPSILADNVTGVSAHGLSTVKLTCSVENPVDGLSLSATCDGTVVTEAEVIDGVVVYTVAQNKGEARDGYITLTYGDVTKVVKVSQLAPVFKVSRTSVELEAAANSSSTITVTSDFDWMSEASTNAGFTYNPTVCEWTDASYASANGKTTVTITASAANASEEGTKTLGTLTFTNMETSETSVVTVTQKSSYVAPSTGTTVSTTISDYISSHSDITVSSDNTVNSIVKELTLDSNITVSAVGTGNTGSFWGTSPNNDWRIYSKSGDEGTVTISASNSKTITSIKVTFSTSNGGGLKLNGTALTSGTAVTVNTSSVSLSVPYKSNKTGQARITAIEVCYE